MRAYERLLQYVRYHTTSDENAPEDKCPTTDRQKVLGAALAEELRGLGLADAAKGQVRSGEVPVSSTHLTQPTKPGV